LDCSNGQALKAASHQVALLYCSSLKQRIIGKKKILSNKIRICLLVREKKKRNNKWVEKEVIWLNK